MVPEKAQVRTACDPTAWMTLVSPPASWGCTENPGQVYIISRSKYLGIKLPYDHIILYRKDFVIRKVSS